MLFSSYFATQVGMYLWKLACPWHNHPAEHILSNKMTKLLLVFCLPQQDYSLVSRLPSTRPMSFSLFSVYFLCDKGFLPACPDNLVISFPAWILELVQEIKYQFLQSVITLLCNVGFQVELVSGVMVNIDINMSYMGYSN